MRPQRSANRAASPRGGFALGVVLGLLVGLALALGVALYITRAPIPFINKVPQRTAEQDSAEAERNRNWDPNAPLGGKAVARQAQAASEAASAASAAMAAPPVTVPVAPPVAAAPASAAAPAKPAGKDPAAILSGADTPRPPSDPFVYFVQAGAYSRSDEAEQQRAKLAMMGQTAKITEREQAGRTVYRVRIGPFQARDEADGLQGRLQEGGIEAQIVRVERP
jgi:cell division protein FtsN